MNKHHYRIIFNKARGTWMAVAEIVKSRGKFASSVVCADSGTRLGKRFVGTLRPVNYVLLTIMGMVHISLSHAEIVADGGAPAARQPTVTQAANGTPQVNIQRPDGTGLSHNRYTRFDVDPQGVILNNARVPFQTELAGWVNGNPNLVGGSARIILNEVNAADPSYLRGFVEVAGDRAQVIVANPAGITCSGCGFINANRATLTTGSPQFDQGALAGFGVRSGEIAIEGQGLDSRGVDYTDLIARAVTVNAGIWAQNLNLVTGANDVTVEGGLRGVHAVAGASPAFAIDVKALGGMYAGKILLVGTEQGVGVHNAGLIGTSAGNLVITANGMLVNQQQIESAAGLSIDVDGVDNRTGTILSLGDLTLTADAVDNSASLIHSNRTLTLQTGTLINNGQIQALEEVDLYAEQIDNREAGVISANATELIATGRLVNRGLVDGATTRIQADWLDNIGSGRLYGDQLAVAARQFTNRESNGSAATVAARNRLDIGTTELINREGALLLSAGDLHIGGYLDELDQAAGKASIITNQSATIEALSQLHVATRELHNNNAHFTKEELSVLVDEPHFEQQWINPEDYYAYDFLRNISEEVMTGSDPARLLAGGDMVLEVDELINDKSHILAGGTLTADIVSLENREGVLERRVEDRGEVWFSWIEYCGSLGKSKCRRETPHTPYAPADTITSITLPMARFEEHAGEPGSGTLIDALAVAGSSTGDGLIQLPNSALFRVHPEPAHQRLVETDPRFAGYRQWLSSDYMLDQLQLDPAATQKRLGDGFYEQRLIQQQITQLTGLRYLTGFQSDEEQYKALMNAGISFALDYDLKPGIALSAEQMVQLTSDIVWLVEQEVMLADGSRQPVLVPQLYAVLEAGDLNGQGALLGGQHAVLDLRGDLLNEGTLLADRSLSLDASNINNRRGTVAAETLALSAERDISNSAGRMRAENRLVLQAGRDISVAAATCESVNRIGASRFERLHLDGIGTLQVMNPDGILTAAAGRDINLTTAHVTNSGAGSATMLMAENQINLNTTVTRKREAIVWDARSYLTEGQTREEGALIETAGDLVMQAEADINGRAATLRSAGALAVNAGGDIHINAGVDEQVWNRRQYIAKSGLFSSKQTIDESRSTVRRVEGSTLSADQINLQAGQDITITGSQIVGTGDVTLGADRDIVIRSGEQTTSSYGYHQERKSGLMTSGFGITLGKRETSDELDKRSSMAIASTVGSIEGDLVISHADNYSQRGSDLLAPAGSVNITAGDIEIVEAKDSMTTRTESRFKQSGLTLSLSTPVIDTAQTIHRMYKSAQRTDDPRLQMLAAATATLAAKDAYDQVKAGQGSTINGREGQIKTGETQPDGSPGTRDATAIDKVGGVTLNISVGSSKYQSTSQIESRTVAGSNLQAGSDITLTAAGDETESDILVRGSAVSAGGSITLDTEREIHLLAAQNSYTRHDTNKSSSASAGVSIGLGTDGAGLAVTASVSRGRGHTDASELSHTNARITAGDTTSIRSGENTTIKGAIVKGNQVTAAVGGDFHIESLQDQSHYDSDQRDSGGNLSVGPGTFSASINSNKTNARGAYASVIEQSGIKAGEEGFDVHVQANTRLIGGMLAATGEAVTEAGNRFTTGTLTASHLENVATANAKSDGYSLSNDMLTQGKYGIAKALIANAQLDAEQESRSRGESRSIISNGEVHITDATEQLERTGKAAEEMITLLDRDVDKAHSAAKKQDAENLQRSVDAVREIKQAVYATAVKFTDETYRTIFIREHPFYEVLRNENGQPLIDQQTGKPKLRMLSEVEKRNLKPGRDGKIKLFTNGIFNDEPVAGGYAMQMSEAPAGDPVYMIYFPEANNALSEVLVAGYQYYLESSMLGISRSSAEVLDAMRRYGESGLTLVGHSRGAMTIGNAMEALETEGDSTGSLLDTDVKLVGPAYNAQEAANRLDRLSDGFSLGVDLQNHADDFVGTIIGKNPATYGNRPAGSSALTETLRLFGDAPTVHSCYGTGDASRGCKDRYGKAPTSNIQPNKNRN